MSEPACRFAVPLCPSTNNLYVTRRFGKGRAKSPAYEEWIDRAGWAVKAIFPTRVAGPVRVEIRAPFDRRRDLDNAAKPILDLAVKLNLIDDDRWVDHLTVLRAPGEAVMTVSIWPM